MARAKVVHSEDAVTVIFEGDKRNPEPTTGVIKFPGGFIEVSRCTDGSYWVHTAIEDPTKITESRITFDTAPMPAVIDIDNFQQLKQIAVRVKV